MELKQIECFLMLARELNFSVAAQKMYISQPSFSRRIQTLEEELGVTLFRRTKREVALTDAGIAFITTANDMVHAAEEIAETAMNLRLGKRGKLRIGYQDSANFVLPRVLDIFCDRYPGIDLTIDGYGASELMAKLLAGELDIVFSFAIIAESLPEYERLSRIEMFSDEVVLFMNRERYRGFRDSHDASHRPRLSDFDDRLFLNISEEVNPHYARYLHDVLDTKLPHHQKVQECAQFNTLLLLLKAGIGVSLLPKHAIERLSPIIRSMKLADVKDRLPIEAIWLPENYNPCLPLLADVIRGTVILAEQDYKNPDR